MKRNYIKNVVLAATAIFSVASFVSCNDDEEDENLQITEDQKIKSFKLYDRWGKQICDLTSEDVYEMPLDTCADYWYEYQFEGSKQVYSGHFTSLK